MYPLIMIRYMEIDRFGGLYSLLIYLACACGSFWCDFPCAGIEIKEKCPPWEAFVGKCLPCCMYELTGKLQDSPRIQISKQ